MLMGLGGRPDPLLELRNRCLGNSIAAFCHVGGWFMPMYGAGWIERRNIEEYDPAAAWPGYAAPRRTSTTCWIWARSSGTTSSYFRLKAASHRLARVLPIWRAPGARGAIR